MEFRKNLPFKSYGVEKPICKCIGAHRQPLSRSFGTNETQQIREGQLVGRMLLQRLATGATGVNKRDTGEGLLGAVRHSYTHMQYIQNASIELLLTNNNNNNNNSNGSHSIRAIDHAPR